MFSTWLLNKIMRKFILSKQSHLGQILNKCPMHTPSIEKASEEGPEHKGERVCLPGLLGYMTQQPKWPQTQVPGLVMDREAEVV